MKILLTTGIFPPETGGPATLTPLIADALIDRGHDVTVLTFSDHVQESVDEKYSFNLVRVVRGNKLSNYWRFFREVWDRIDDVDFVYSLGWFTAGIPLSLAARLKKKPYVVRVGGDYAWERYLSWGREPLTIREFYSTGVYKKGGLSVFFMLIKWVFSGAHHVVFNSDVQRELYEKYYKLDSDKTITIYNPSPRLSVDSDRTLRKEIFFAGRLEEKNNVSTLIDAFALADLDSFKLTIVGEGSQKKKLMDKVSDHGMEETITFLLPMDKSQLLKHMKDVYCVVLPSWTDVSPNTAYEALSLGVPLVITEENYLPFRDSLNMMFDPHSSKQLSQILEHLGDEVEHHRAKQQISTIDFQHSLDDFIHKHVMLFNTIQS
ncbi:MAG: glycosyltransferase family 4 protein [Candidatus Paceibacterota bacterium]